MSELGWWLLMTVVSTGFSFGITWLLVSMRLDDMGGERLAMWKAIDRIEKRIHDFFGGSESEAKR